MIETFLIVTVVWIFSVCLHEFGHAIIAYKGGDFTVKDKGYLTLNPIHYTHPVYSFIMPLVFLLLGGIGLPGGAVYINDHLLRSKKWRTAVSLGGPAMNAILVLLLCIPFWLGIFPGNERSLLACALAFLVQLQISAILFNLIPIPPLDGFNALRPWLPGHISERFMEQANVALFALFLLFWYVPVVGNVFWSVVFGISDVLGVDPRLGILGWNDFRFWNKGF